ncbi:indoleamine 2,3-dioxygenase [Nonomuraea zeae]|uniref:indoleamine 2,3-dioxygenase n=1 Tax=Nonomuraea zeae TaxID=1642303 RepID=UPI001478725F|nr:indoleamine 2,3-dioxygenase [Nonomuraea zeae]
MTHKTTRARAARPLVTALGEYAIDERRGFVPGEDPVDALPARYRPWEDVAGNIAALIMTGRLRAAIASMPVLTPDGLASGGERERAMLLLSCLANAYVHGTGPLARTLPAPVARPLYELARLLDRAPIVSHASIVLNNWRRIDAAEPLSMSNADTQLTFLGGVDEKWFYLATVGVELSGAPGLPLLVQAQHAVAAEDHARLAEALLGLAKVLGRVTEAVLDVERWCDPYVFYHRIRPFLTGWPAPGLRFEGVDREPLVLAGGSAAQSSLIQAFDAGLDVEHRDELTAGFLTGMRAYMPGPHRRFLQDLESGPSVRDFAARHREELPRLSEAYNAAVSGLARLRAQHIGITGRYINRFEQGADAKGTGGSDFIGFLRRSREETVERLLP